MLLHCINGRDTLLSSRARNRRPGGSEIGRISENRIKKYKSMGLDAIEVYYSNHTLADIKKFARIAKRFDLIATGGTDYHGSRGISAKIGIGSNNLKRF